MSPFLFLLSILLLTGSVVAGIKAKHHHVKSVAHLAAFLFAGTTAFTATYFLSPPKHIAALDEPIQKPVQLNHNYQNSMPQPTIESSKYPTPIINPDPTPDPEAPSQLLKNW